MKRPKQVRRRRKTEFRGSAKPAFRPRRFLLTRNESAFFCVLAATIGDDYQISCKVRLADIITCSDRDWQRGRANRIAQKHVDFVVTHVRSSRIVAAIELDDCSHLRRDRRLRDAFVNELFRQTRIRLIRIPAAWKYEREHVAAFLTEGGLFTRIDAYPSETCRRQLTRN